MRKVLARTALIPILLMFLPCIGDIRSFCAFGQSDQPALQAPWRGRRTISQPNHGNRSHNVCGQRTLDPKNCAWENTYALDIPMDSGTEVLAPADGDIVFVDDDTKGSGGREIGIEVTGPTGKKFVVVFLHLSKILVTSGPVKQGDPIAKSGGSSDGSETGTPNHLHMHIWSGTGSKDSHTLPIERLVMASGSQFREYNEKNGDLDKVSGKSFASANGVNTVTFDGFLDSVKCDKIEGWAWDASHPDSTASVDVFDGTSKLGTATANNFRADLRSNGIGDGNHAFTFFTPQSLKDGRQHTIVAKVTNTSIQLGTATPPLISSCAASPTAIISMSGGNKSGGSGSPLNFLIPSGGNIQINFNAFASKAGAAAIKAYNWLRQTILPNKSSLEAVGVSSSSVAPSYSDYLGAGTHNITLQVTDETGATDTTTATVTISESQVGPPAITSINPGSLSPSIFNLTINGANFDNGAIDQLYFGDRLVGNGTIVSRSSNQMVVQESMATATLGTYSVKVKNSDGQLSNGMPLVLSQTQNTAPSITQISPASVSPSTFDLTINGSNFDSGAIDQVFYGAQLVGSGQILSRTANQIVVRESMPTATLGTYTVKVKNSNGQLSNGVGLTLAQTQGTAPSITSMSPNPVPGAAANQTVAVIGTGFVNGAGLKVRVTYPGGQADLQGAQVSFVSSTQLNILINVGTNGANWTAQVVNPDGLSSNLFAFSVTGVTGPHITNVSPNPMTGSNNQQTLTINGSGFSSSSTVTLRSPFQTYSNLPTSSITATQIIMPVTIGTTAAQWTAEVIDHGLSSGQFPFQVVAPTPHIDSMTPNPVPGAASDQIVSIFGSNFVNGSGLKVRVSFPTGQTDLQGGQVTFVSSTQLNILITVGTNAANWTAQVINPNGTGSNVFPFSVSGAAAPHINSVTPNPMTGSNSPQTLTINGTGFTSASTVTLRSPFQTYTNLPTTSITSTQIVMQVTIGTTAAQWTAEVIDHGVSSGQFAFQVVAPAPHIDSMSPNPVPGSASNQTVTIFGSNFVNGTGLKVRVVFPTGQTDLQGSQVTFVSSTQLSILITVGTSAANWTAQVINPDGTSSNVFPFSVTAAAGPHITSVSPNPMTGSNNPQTFTINGSGFTSSSTVTLRSPFQTYSNLPTTSITSTQIVMQVTIGTSAAQWTVEVIDHGVSSGQFAFQVVAPPTPQITSVSPNPVTGSNSSQTFTINGSGFTSSSTVTLRSPFQTYPNQPTSSITSTRITMPVTFGTTAAQWTVEVIDSGQSSGQFAFQVIAPTPSISSISPNPVPTFNANQNVQVFGSNFQSSLTVDVFNSSGSKISTLSGSQILNVSASSFTMVVNLGSSASSFGIEVVNPGGSRSSRFTFSTTAFNPSVSSISPNPVPVFNGNQSVQVFGSSFQSGLIVDVFNSSGSKVGTLSGSGQIQNVTASSFTMVINLGGSAGTFGIEVVNPNGGRSSRFTFSY